MNLSTDKAEPRQYSNKKFGFNLYPEDKAKLENRTRYYKISFGRYKARLHVLDIVNIFKKLRKELPAKITHTYYRMLRRKVDV